MSPATPQKRSFGADFKRFFVRGLAVLLPSVLTLWLLVYAYQFVDGFIARPINGWLRTGLAWSADYVEPLREAFDPTEQDVADEIAAHTRASGPAPSARAVAYAIRQERIDAWWNARWWTDLIGLLVAVVGVYLAGRLVGGFVGRSIWGRLERLIVSIPVVRAVYPSVKQVVDFLIADERPMRFSRVVAVEYPRQGVWSVGLVTSEGVKTIAPTDQDAITVFVPSSPTPFTGYTITVGRDQVHELPITVDQALRFLVSGGVLVPEPAPPATGGAPPPGQAAAADLGVKVAAGRAKAK